MNGTSKNLDRVLRPKTIAVFGGRFAQAVTNQCDKMGYAGEIWPVHPSRDQIGDRSCFRDVHSLPDAPDVSFIGVNRHQTINIVAELSQRGAGGAVCYASGFQETGDSDLNEKLIAAANSMPALGPNCYGFINYLDGALLWPDQHGGKRVDSGVAILMQSSNIAINLTMNKRATPIAYMITLGNQAMVGMSDMIIQLCQDDRVTAIGLHIEALDDVHKFCTAIQIAHEYKKPVVVLKTGKSVKGAAITMTHTASLSSNDMVIDALFDQLGITRVQTLAEFLEALKLLHVCGALPGSDMVSMSCSGGEASLISDASEKYSVEFPDFSEQDVERIKPTVNELVSISNPFDYHTFDWANYDRLKVTFSAVMQSGVTMNALVMDFPRQDRCDIDEWIVSLSAWQHAAEQTNSRAAIIASIAESMPEDIAEMLIENNIVPFCGIENTLAAVEASAKITANIESFTPLINEQDTSLPIITLDEYESKQKLAKYSITIAESALCSSKQEAVEIANQIGYPVVAKAVGDNLAHKTELGAVKLNLKDELGVEAAMEDLVKHSNQFLVEKMITDSEVELIVGINRDPVVGLYLIIGAGGIYTELLSDTKTILFPFEKSQIEQAISSLKIATLFNGYRNHPLIPIDSLIETIMNIQQFAIAHQHLLQEMDINPLMVCSDGKVFAADALIRMNDDQVKSTT